MIDDITDAQKCAMLASMLAMQEMIDQIRRDLNESDVELREINRELKARQRARFSRPAD